MKTNFNKYLKYIIIATVALAFIYLLTSNGLIKNIKNFYTNEEKIRRYILGFGPYGSIIFFILQVIQIIFAPIPGNLTTVIGGSLFGATTSFLISLLATITGSTIAYYIAKFFGKPLVIKFIGEKNYNKYIVIFKKRYPLALLLIFLFPFFPDDILCFLAGLSYMPYRLFLVLVIVGRTPSIFIGSLVGSGLIKLSLEYWIVISIISLFIIYSSIKYKDKLEEWMYKKLKLNK